MIIQGNSCVNILHSTYRLPPAEFSARSSDAWMFFWLYIIMKKFVKFALPTLLFLYEYMPFLVLDPFHFSYMLLYLLLPFPLCNYINCFYLLIMLHDLTIIPGFPVLMIVANTLHIVYNSWRNRNRWTVAPKWTR